MNDWSKQPLPALQSPDPQAAVETIGPCSVTCVTHPSVMPPFPQRCLISNLSHADKRRRCGTVLVHQRCTLLTKTDCKTKMLSLLHWLTRKAHRSILCLTSRTIVTSARIPEEDACYRARNLCIFSRVQKGTPGLMHKGCVLQRVSLGAFSDVTVVFGMRQSIY